MLDRGTRAGRALLIGLLGAGLTVATGLTMSAASVAAATSTAPYAVSALQTDLQAGLHGIDCPSAGSCLAVGSTTSSSFVTETLAKGAWTPASVTTHLALPTLTSVWCASVTSCIAVGSDGQVATDQTALVETLANGSWTAAASTLAPSGATTSALTAISCTSISFCVATGSYTDSGGTGHALFDTLSNGTWTPSTDGSPSGAITVLPKAIECASTTLCVAVGEWLPNDTTANPLIELLSNGSWSSAASALGQSRDTLSALSCTSSSACLAVGEDMAGQGVTETLNGTKLTRGLLPVPSGMSLNGMNAVACVGNTSSCVALGGYRATASASSPDTLVETLSGGTWTPTTGLDPSSIGYGVPAAISCPTLSSCIGVGSLLGATLPGGGQSTYPMAVTTTTSGTSSGGGSGDGGSGSGSGGGSGSGSGATGSSSHGYWLVGSDGGIFSFGAAAFHGSTGSLHLNRPIVGITPTADHQGYRLVGSDGGLFAFGDGTYLGSIPALGLAPAGSTAAKHLDAPIVGMVPSADGAGYFMVGADGGVFAFGDAAYEGSCPGIGGCSGTAVGVAPDSTGHGYWLVTSNGHVYAFGDATNLGSPGTQTTPVTSIVRTPDGKGYWVLDGAGNVFSYGDAAYEGALSSGITTWTNPASAIFSPSGTTGYWIATATGQVFPYGGAPSDGDMAGTHLNGSIIAASGF